MGFRWQTWSPFQSPETRAICEHMTPGDRVRIASRGAVYGLWVAATFSGPIAFLVFASTMGRPEPWQVWSAVALLALHVACVPIWQRSMRRFLCSTAWAKQHGFDPDTLRMFSFRSGKPHLPIQDGLD